MKITFSENSSEPVLDIDPLPEAANKLKMAEKLRQAKKLDQSKLICEELILKFPDYVGALHTLGLILADLKLYEEAATTLSKAALLCPSDWRILTALSGVNIKLNRPDAAIGTLQQAQTVQGNEPNIVGTLAEIYRHQKEYELSAESFEALLKFEPTLTEAKYFLADCYEQLGIYDRATELYKSMINDGRYTLAAISNLAQLPESITSFNQFDLLDTISLSQPGDENNLHYARAIACHRAGKYREAWEHLVAANKNKKEEMVNEWHRAATHRANILEFASSLPTLIEASQPPIDTPLSLFILGPSRSGKTTLERLVGTLPGVKRGYESPVVENAVRRTMQTSGCITRLSINGMPSGLDSTFMINYSAELSKRARGSQVFTNTHPGKIGEVLRYAKSVQGSRFLFVKRNTDDLMLRIYMRNYESGNAYAYDILTIAEHLDWYNKLIDICAEKLPGISKIISYEDMIMDPAATRAVASNLCSVGDSAASVPPLGDDRGIAEPYKHYIRVALEH